MAPLLQADAFDSIIQAHGQAAIAAHAACTSEADSRPNTADTTTSEPHHGHAGSANALQRPGQSQPGDSLAAADMSKVPVKRTKKRQRASKQDGKEAGPAAQSSGQTCSPVWQVVLLPSYCCGVLWFSCLPP